MAKRHDSYYFVPKRILVTYGNSRKVQIILVGDLNIDSLSKRVE